MICVTVYTITLTIKYTQPHHTFTSNTEWTCGVIEYTSQIWINVKDKSIVHEFFFSIVLRGYIKLQTDLDCF